MKTSKSKKKYHAPKLQQIPLDNEISLVLQSPADDPSGGSWWGKNEHNNTDVFKTSLG